MTRRRRGAHQDSLELLLDTICNTFGGVLFIAILVVMLLQNAGQAPESVDVPVSPEKLEERTRQLEQLSSEVVRVKQIQVSQSALIDSLLPGTVRELMERRKQLLTKHTELQTAVDAEQIANAALAANVARVQAEIDKLNEELRALREQNAKAQLQLAAEQQAKVKDVHLPKQHSAGHKQEIGFVLRYGRLYIWHVYDNDLRRTGLNLQEFVVISDEGDHLVTRPKPTAGTPLTDTIECRNAIDDLLRRFDPNRHIICSVVRPDTYGEFKYFRDRVLALGFEYRLIPMGDKSGVSDRGGAGGQVQ